MKLIISNLFASVEGKEILHGVTLTVNQGEIHAVMGPNGSGKSTLASVLLGHPSYEIGKKSRISIGGINITHLPTDERARQGLFLAFQSPVAIPGVTVMNLMRTAFEMREPTVKSPKKPTVQNPVLAKRFQVGSMSIGQFSDMVNEYASAVRVPEELLRRGIHDGFSGGEKKKIEMLQALVLSTKFAVFDEIDTGLDVDALKAVSNGIAMLQKRGVGVIVITHYQRILQYVKPGHVHVLVAGKIADSGDADLARKIETSGYAKYLK